MPETGLGQGSDVVLGMTAKCDLTKGFAVEMDNFLTTLSPLCKLKDMPMYGVGTIRKNRQQGAPLKKTAAAEKETRVLFDCKSMETICFSPGETTKLSSLTPTIFR